MTSWVHFSFNALCVLIWTCVVSRFLCFKHYHNNNDDSGKEDGSQDMLCTGGGALQELLIVGITNGTL